MPAVMAGVVVISMDGRPYNIGCANHYPMDGDILRRRNDTQSAWQTFRFSVGTWVPASSAEIALEFPCKLATEYIYGKERIYIRRFI